MIPPDFQSVEEIFHAALECEPNQLDAFLSEKCAGDKILRREVDALLALHRRAGSFIETPVADVAASLLKEDETDLLIGQTIGHYKILQRITAGGMGEVYLATDTIVGRKAALKFLHARFTGDAMRLKRFQQEARAVAGLNHPNIVTIYEVGEADSVQYIASELIEGETLRQRLTRGRMRVEAAIDVAIQVAGALAAAHSAGIVHRDVKPENIMLRPDRYVKVLDFGIAKLAEQEVPVTMPQEEALLLVETNLGSVLGTVRYMSPEQARGAPVDRRTDIWSLGIVLYEMAVGHAPFAGDTPKKVMTAILKTEPRPLSSHRAQVPGEFEPIVSKALQKDPGQRYQNTSEMLEDLKALRRKLEFAAEMAKSAPHKSIAVFPFENLSSDPDSVYLAHGIQKEILTRLSRIGDLKVVSRSSTQQYDSRPANLQEIARQLGAAHVLQGSIQQNGDQARVHVELINAETGSHLWAEKYDRKLTDIFAVETDIASKIADTLQAKLSGAEQRAIASHPTENSQAHQMYLKGVYYWNKFLAPGFEKSGDYFQRAIDLDPSYALAYAGLSDYYGFASALGLMRPDDGWPKCESAANKALALDETLAEAYNPLAAIKLYWCRDWTAAERAFRRGIELNPSFAEIRLHYALCLILFGRNEDALKEVRRAVELDPASLRFNLNWARILFFMREYDRAIDQFHVTLELEPNYALPHEWLGYAYEKKGMQKESITEWSNALSLSTAPYGSALPNRETQEYQDATLLEHTYASSGFEAAVRALAQRRLEQLDERTARSQYVAAAEFVMAYMRLGDHEQALAWLAKAAAERNRFVLEIRIDPRFDPLRSDSRFEEIINSAGLPERIHVLGDTKSPIKKSIAVLPFENLSDDKANAYFADGIQEEILTRLSRIGDLKVISRTSTQRFRNTTEPVREIARQLSVATILEGSVRKAGDKVRVHVQLIDAENDVHVWAERYDRELVDIFAVESDIAENIADVLKAKLTRAERRAITSRPTQNLQAHQLYLKARHQWKNFFAPGYEKIREYLEQAIALDPTYAPALTGLSGYYAFGAANGMLPPDECWPRAEEGLRKSLALDDTLAEPYNLLAGVELYYKRDWPAAEQAFLHGAELDPNFADIPHHYALCLALFGRNEEALAQIDRAALLDPFFPGLHLHRGRISFFLRDYDLAIKQFAETLELYPEYAPAHEYLGDAYEKKGMLREAITQWCAAFRLSGEPEHANLLEQVFATSGFHAAVHALAQRQLDDLDRKRLGGDYVPAAHYVFACVRGGDLDQAFAWLPKMIDERNWFALHIRVNPILDQLRADPRFEELASRIFPPDLKKDR